MVTIRYSLTPNDLAELGCERRREFSRRVLRVIAGSILGFLGLILVWQALFLFPWNRPFANLTFAGMGLLLLWIGFELPGLAWLFHRLADPFAEREAQVYQGRVVTVCKGKVRQFRWLPKQGFREKSKFFLLSSFRSGYELVIPKHAVTREQEQGLRDLVEKDPVVGSPIECSFFLTEEDLNEARAAGHPWLGSRYGRILSRVTCALCTLGLPVLFWMIKSGRILSDLQPLSGKPLIVAGVVTFELLCLLGSGGVGTKVLNCLNQERRILVDDRQISITRGTRTTTHNWKRFLCYQETANLFVLRALITVEFVAIPKRGLRPGEEERLRTLLNNYLPDKFSAF